MYGSPPLMHMHVYTMSRTANILLRVHASPKCSQFNAIINIPTNISDLKVIYPWQILELPLELHTISCTIYGLQLPE